MDIKTVRRNVNFFDLIVGKEHKKSEKDMLDLFRHIQTLAKSKMAGRFIKRGDKVLYIRNVDFRGTEKQLWGRILLIREDALPELLDRKTDELRGVDANLNEDIVEASHFIVSYKGIPQIAFEHNHQGARLTDLEFYLETLAQTSSIAETVSLMPITKDDILSYKARMNRVSYLIGRIHKDELARINDPDKGLISAFETAANVSRAEYVEMKLKFDFTSTADSGFIKQSINALIDFVRRRKHVPFDLLKVQAEDTENENRMKEFDLLNAWVRGVVDVQQNERFRTIIPLDMYEKMAKVFKKELGR
ncbi:MAG: hypothetical protein ABI432_04205 [Flavobacteriales bacterium]